MVDNTSLSNYNVKACVRMCFFYACICSAENALPRRRQLQSN